MISVRPGEKEQAIFMPIVIGVGGRGRVRAVSVKEGGAGASRGRTAPSVLHQEPKAITWAREKAGLTKRALAGRVGISEQLMGEIESGWRSATPANLMKIADALNCPVVLLECKRSTTVG